MVKLPVEQFGLFLVGKPSVIAEEAVWASKCGPNPPSFRAIGVLGNDLVATATLLFSELIFRDFSRTGSGISAMTRETDSSGSVRTRSQLGQLGIDMPRVVIEIGENTVTVGTVRLPDPDRPVWVGWWLGRSVVAGVASG